MKQDQPELYTGDQTSFSQQAPLFEQPQVIPTEEGERISPRRNRILLMASIVVGLGCLIGGIWLWYSTRQTPLMTSPEPTLLPSTVPTAVSPLQSRLEEVKADLEIADPTRRDFSFPPVDLELQLSE